MQNLINIINDKKLNRFLTKCNFGIEKENVRVDSSGHLAMTKHPEIFGDKLKNPYITTDFSESQVEMITPSMDTVEETYNFLESLHDMVSLELKEEYLWPQSTPPSLPAEEDIPVSIFEETCEGNRAQKYRDYLSKKYGKQKQLLSGIHYNFSFKDEFLYLLHKESKTSDFKLFKDEIYLKISRNFFKYRWILIYLFGANPSIHGTYSRKCVDMLDEVAPDSFSYTSGNSFRNGMCGYKNKEVFNISYNSRAEYVKDIKKLISQEKLINEKEYYSPIRLKAKDNTNLLKSIEEDGIEYLEVRLLDLNPMIKTGISIDQLYFVHLFLLFCLFTDEDSLTEKEIWEGNKNHELVAHYGRKTDLELFNQGEFKFLKDLGLDIISKMEKIVEDLGISDLNYINTLREAVESFYDTDLLISSKIESGIREEGFIDFNLNLAKKYYKESLVDNFALRGYEDLELSTQILLKDAIKRGIRFEILDRKENFISLTVDGKTEYIVQATKTSLDSYSTVLIMENKLVTKKILEKNKIKVPKGGYYTNSEDAVDDFYRYQGSKTVVKPNSTNFGLGITILPKDFTPEDYQNALKFAFKEDDSILVEEFIEGKEYRVFVLKNKVVGILHRVPANVVGDGKHSIRTLVEDKNKDPLRGTGYKKPLQKIALGEAEETFLAGQNLNFDYIPQKDETVYLRENSNISTGGDSIDFTDDILDEYKEIAIDSARAADATICGVDMMIKDIKELPNDSNHGIIEINFNPAIHIHCYPYKGKNRKLGEKILDSLGF
ncbi:MULTISPECIES: bifunctional glutamate--cysteine ligase GshA/glutathione synthetase GshB [Psychrilyobacter]|uniref:glutamate--cysteine ligase n=1 Tax=Psychrilyobacter piezotolerans TaxID=2293438 RepID=A0ABX9KEV8_9FUSO|nr:MULTISPECIES: bifunctional glutamate--cysteine ligase GshA/glutathione synthetase GshB [Psychrilyobacter]MCS5422092.1 bifunctional glutamate--cysteine ligase GshA/glutathione synthetase GshB [Psychrilyobacter sp. S5]NDI78658.1 bifunctional glutamate--cysteine ligase GshA/glutathione synthetase GshB [Psychrilyobacter piezotolerans]RDE60010.1 bifunctional glutamate--cysteine ligase GshA/glutathione synthetase GshB [Psychrilyobacter sp. S5]REI40237.1 bifunctional glutamate--cysteine ligase GshA